MGKFGRGKHWRIWQIVSHLPKFSLPIFTGTQKTYIAYALTVAYSLNFSSPITFLPKFSPTKYFPCTVLCMCIVKMKLYAKSKTTTGKSFSPDGFKSRSASDKLKNTHPCMYIHTLVQDSVSVWGTSITHSNSGSTHLHK